MTLLRTVLADGPVGYWPCDDASGAVVDRSGNGRNGSVSGTGTFKGRTVLPGELGYDLQGGYINWSDSPAFSAHAGATGLQTVELWVNPSSTPGSNAWIFGKGDSNQYEWGVWHNTNNAVGFSWWILNGTDLEWAFAPTGTLPVGAYTHCVGVYDRAAPNIICYVNGVEVARNTGGGWTAGNGSDGSGAVRAGVRADNLGGVYHGGIAHIAYYNSALSAARIAAHYADGIRSGVSIG